MLELRAIRENPEAVKRAVALKGEKVDVDQILSLDERHRALLKEVESLRAEKNRWSREVGERRRVGQDAPEIVARTREVDARREELEEEQKRLKRELDELLLRVPNIPHPSVPEGTDEGANVEVRRWGEIPTFPFEPRPHWEIGARLGIIDIPRGSRLAGTGFIHYSGLGARLERALINFMVDLHATRHDYTEVFPPFLVTRESMTVTGQLPKLEDDMYLLPQEDLFLIPTGEVPVTNLHREETLRADQLPIRYVAYTACFRREAGAHGKDTRGLIRVHQFDKVELVKFVRPETSYDELESLVRDAEEVLQLLGLPYRVMCLSAGDLSFAAAKCYDIEAWAPGVGKYLEVSSCSNFEDFQARRGKIRYRPHEREKPEFVHTLNGSGVALPRTVIALLETYQQADGSVVIPPALRPYMGGLERLA